MGGQSRHLSTGERVPPDLKGLIVDPKLWLLSDTELCCVADLRISRPGVGQVTFHGITDCRGLVDQLTEIIVVEQGEVVVYPDQSSKPDEGKGLNKPASIVLYGCMPKQAERYSDPSVRWKYKQRVAEMTEAKGAVFEDYNCDDGTWKFRVHHF